MFLRHHQGWDIVCMLIWRSKHYSIILALLLVFVSPSQAMAQPDSHFSHLDIDKNGSVSLAESEAAASESFKGLDTNRDGDVTRIEYTSKIKASMAGKDIADSERKRAERVLSRRFSAIDLDQNDIVTQAEFMQDNARQHKELDNNGDGNVTPEDVEAKQAVWREEFKNRTEEQRKADKEAIPMNDNGIVPVE